MKTKAYFKVSKKKVLEYYHKVKDHCDTVSYSFKTNAEVGKVLQDTTDCLFSVHSAEELVVANAHQRAMIFLQGDSEEDITLFLKKKVWGFVVDNERDMATLLKTAEMCKTGITLFLRMRLKENTVHTGKHFVFGFFSWQIAELIPQLAKHNSVHKLGIHVHRKTQNVSEWSLENELKESVSHELLNHISYVNIGGGLPSQYYNYQDDVTPSIFNRIDQLRMFLAGYNIQIIIEPGRFIAAPAVQLVTNIVNMYHNTIVVDASVYNSAMDTFIAHIKLSVEHEVSIHEGEAYTIKGCTPDSLDIFRYRVFLNKPKVGDKIVFLNAGAYNFSTDFCFLPKLKTLIDE